MQQHQPKKVFTSSAALQMIHRRETELQSLPNTKMIFGRTLETSDNLETVMVRSPPVHWQWLLEETPSMEQRELTNFHYSKIIIIIELFSNLNFRLQTEIWEIETVENRVIAPSLPHSNYREVGLFLVDKGYCKNAWLKSYIDKKK